MPVYTEVVDLPRVQNLVLPYSFFDILRYPSAHITLTCFWKSKKMLILSLLLCLVNLGNSRDIAFPPVSGIGRTPGQIPFRLQEENDDDVDLTTDGVGGLTSFAHLPYVPCFVAKADEDIDKYDIAVLGAPFDTATSYRPGARFGPHGIRDGSRRIRGPHSWNLYSRRNSFEEWAKVVDCGDAPLTFMDNTVALKQLVKAHKVSPPVSDFECTYSRPLRLHPAAQLTTRPSLKLLAS